MDREDSFFLVLDRQAGRRREAQMFALTRSERTPRWFRRPHPADALDDVARTATTRADHVTRQ